MIRDSLQSMMIFGLPSGIMFALQAAGRYEIPVWHPIAVHYPIALVGAGMLSALGWLLAGSAFWRHCTAYIYGLALLATGAAYWTGEEAYEQSKDVPIVDELAHVHADYATYSLIGVAVVAAAVFAGTVWVKRCSSPGGNSMRDPFWLRVIIALLSALTTGLVGYTAHLGGLMVWGTVVQSS